MPYLASRYGNLFSHVPAESLDVIRQWLANWLDAAVVLDGLRVGIIDADGRTNYDDPRVKGIVIYQTAESEEYRYVGMEDGKAVTKVARDYTSCVALLLRYLELDAHDYGIDFAFRPETGRILDVTGIHHYASHRVEWIKPGFTIVSF